MTRQESFKRRIRARMEKTGEKYNAARRALIEKASAGEDWVSQPETSDDAVREATGRGWEEWRRILDAWPGDVKDHRAMARFVQEEHGVDGWWSQTVTVGYERITGLRLPYQRPDGTFTVGKSRTVTVDATALREMLLDPAGRRDLFPGHDTELRSRPTTRDPRVRIGPGTALFTLDQLDDGRVKVTVTHEKLPDPGQVELWKEYWSDWLEAVDEG